MLGLVNRPHSTHVKQVENVIARMIEQLGRQRRAILRMRSARRLQSPSLGSRVAMAKRTHGLLASGTRLDVSTDGRAIKVTQPTVEELLQLVVRRARNH